MVEMTYEGNTTIFKTLNDNIPPQMISISIDRPREKSITTKTLETILLGYNHDASLKYIKSPTTLTNPTMIFSSTTLEGDQILASKHVILKVVPYRD